MTEPSERCEWPSCRAAPGPGQGVRYLGRLLCDAHWARVCSLSGYDGAEAILAKMLNLPVERIERTMAVAVEK